MYRDADPASDVYLAAHLNSHPINESSAGCEEERFVTVVSVLYTREALR